jgi:hypothetical protein
LRLALSLVLCVQNAAPMVRLNKLQIDR